MKLAYRHSLPTVVIHWLMVLTVVASIVTGFRIAIDSLNTDTALFYQSFDAVLPQGSVIYWHINAGIVLTSIIIAYFIYIFSNGRFKQFSLHKKRVLQHTLVQYLNTLCYWLMLFTFVGLFVSGMSQYFSFYLLTPIWLEKIHRFCAWSLIGLIFLHIVLHVLNGGFIRLLTIFIARTKHLKYGAAALIGALLFLTSFYGTQAKINDVLVIHASPLTPIIDGIPDDAAWQNITPVTINTAHGENLQDTAVKVNIRAIHNQDDAYFLIEWPDTTRSQKHLPLIKTQHGWKVLQSHLRKATEGDFYEDKLAIMLASGDSWAASHSIHLGPKPSASHPASASGRGLHYTEDGSLLDIWHWKSVRSNAVAQADDNFISVPKTGDHQTQAYFDRMASGSYPLPNRYFGGLKKDPPMTWSSFDMNWEAFDEEYVLPRRLPKDDDVIKHEADIDLSTAASDSGQWWMDYNDTVPYRAELDNYPIGTVIPGVIITEPAGGDRGDVSAYGTWKDGVWRLEMKRKLDTHSKYDIPIANYTLLWVAVFDHTQTRHSYHIRPLTLSLD